MCLMLAHVGIHLEEGHLNVTTTHGLLINRVGTHGHGGVLGLPAARIAVLAHDQGPEAESGNQTNRLKAVTWRTAARKSKCVYL